MEGAKLVKGQGEFKNFGDELILDILELKMKSKKKKSFRGQLPF